jgi:hypothetical protein
MARRHGTDRDSRRFTAERVDEVWEKAKKSLAKIQIFIGVILRETRSTNRHTVRIPKRAGKLTTRNQWTKVELTI